jgi:hypothetical protein
LDSSTALDFVKALRVLTNVGQKTSLATLYQAGEDIYRTFDRVIVLDQGHEAFFGNTTEAWAYFENLGYVPIPGQTTAEFLMTVTDPDQRRTHPGSQAEKINTPAELAQVFRESDQFKQLQSEIQSYQTEVEAKQAPPPSDTYALSFPAQVVECFRREVQLVKAQRHVYYTKWVTTIILCLVCGSVYFDITNNAQGAFTRGGILYFALIINGWLQFPELFDAHTNRPVVERQGMRYSYS